MFTSTYPCDPSHWNALSVQLRYTPERLHRMLEAGSSLTMSKLKLASPFLGAGSGYQRPPPQMDGVAFVPVAVAEALAVPPRPSETVTVPVKVARLLTVHVAEGPLPEAHPDQE
jgi:hypothetical protein